MSFLKRLVKADIALMRVLGGKPNETLSSAAWNAHITGRFFGFTYLLIDWMFYPWERDHCHKDWEYRKEIYERPHATASSNDAADSR